MKHTLSVSQCYTRMHSASKTSNSCALSFDMIEIQCRIVLYYRAITSKHVCIVGYVFTCDPHNIELTMLNVLLYHCVKVFNPGLFIVCALKCVCKLGKNLLLPLLELGEMLFIYA